MAKKLATTIYITEQQRLCSKELNRRSRVTSRQIVREVVDLVVQKHKAHRNRSVGLGEIGTQSVLQDFASQQISDSFKGR